jgi:hypothetical protein
MRRAPVTLTMFIGLMLVLAACASPAGSPVESAGGEPSVPTTESQAPAESQDGGGGGGGGGNGQNPAFSDGPWTGGQGQTTTSGAVSHSTDAAITTDVSVTENGTTLLAYNTDDTFVTIIINRPGGNPPFHAAVDAPDFSASASDSCEYTLTQAEDNAIEGTFNCVVEEFFYYGDPDPTGEVRIEGSFTATR